MPDVMSGVPRRLVGCALFAAASAACTPPPPTAIQGPPRPPPSAMSIQAGDWPAYNRDLAGTRHSPLRQIDTANVADLRRAWSYPLGRAGTAGDGDDGGSELTPLAIGGVLFVTAADRVVALDAATGEERWRFAVADGSPSRHALAYWPGELGVQARVYFTVGRKLVALDAASGLKSPLFGNGGEVEMPAVYDGAPTPFQNSLIVGASSSPGSVRAYDARTGAELWAFASVPEPGDPAADSWIGDASRARPNVLHSAYAFTVDADRALLYAAFDNPGPGDYYGGDRPGDNLYGSSIVALDAHTGERRWHFQTVRHDIWDYDVPAPPALLDVEIAGATVPALALAGKTGYLYLLNRVTGAPLFGMEERAVPQSDVPGEKTSPTQPIPLKPPPLARVSYVADDLVTTADTTEEHADFCKKLRDRSGGLQNSGSFTPYGFRAAGKKPVTTLVFPGSIGGANRGGAAVDPGAGFVFVNTMDAGSLGWIEVLPADADGDAQRYRRMSAIGGPAARFWWNDADAGSGGNELGGERAWPCQKPPWGRLVAVNGATGDIAWAVPLGITEQLPAAKQRTGRPNLGGPITTAGGLVFIGATNDRRLRAFNSRTGAELWSTRLEQSAHAVPITYLGANGKQFVAIVTGGMSDIDDRDSPGAQALVAYSLP